MEIYSGTYLKIEFNQKKDRFIQFWKQSPSSIFEFKNEMLAYTNLYKRFRPSQTLWLQKNFKLDLDNVTHAWIEENVNIPCVKYGNKKAAFVVGEDVLAHLSVINSFEELKSVVRPCHFATEKEATAWLDDTPKEISSSAKAKISFEGVDQDGNSVFKIKRPSNEIKETIDSIKKMLDDEDFARERQAKFEELTNREKQILVLYAKGFKHQKIADELFISLHTVRTHLKNLKNKLEIKSISDAVKYIDAFKAK